MQASPFYAKAGSSGFKQPRVAAEAGLRQSHLTYYFPTRADLLAGVARAAVERQLEEVDANIRCAIAPGGGKGDRQCCRAA